MRMMEMRGWESYVPAIILLPQGGVFNVCYQGGYIYKIRVNILKDHLENITGRGQVEAF